MYRDVGGCGGLVGEKLGALLAGSGVEIKFVVGHLPYDVSRRIHHMGLAHMDTSSQLSVIRLCMNLYWKPMKCTVFL